MFHAAQIRAARALLGWRQDDLARASGVGPATIRRIEVLNGVVTGNVSTEIRIRQAFERRGIRFIDDEEGVGVRLDFAQSKKRGKMKG
jgi:transcriptional regulator with XRE-family HTH domain